MDFYTHLFLYHGLCWLGGRSRTLRLAMMVAHLSLQVVHAIDQVVGCCSVRKENGPFYRPSLYYHLRDITHVIERDQKCPVRKGGKNDWAIDTQIRLALGHPLKFHSVHNASYTTSSVSIKRAFKATLLFL